MKTLILLLFFTCICVTDVFAEGGNTDYTLYLIRHAEKQADGSRDPLLTEAGLTRSQKLASWFLDKNIEDIWSSDYFRTRDTATPLLSQTRLELSIYDPGSLPQLAGNLTDRQRNALIVGHSNTTPDLARLLCDCSIADMDDSEHDRIIVISIVNGETTTEQLDQSILFQP